MKLAEETIQRLLTLKVDATEKLSAPMTIQQICEAVRDMVQPIASHQRVLFQMKDCCGSDGKKISGDCLETWVDDGSSIVGAIVNLILNALEAAGPGGEVEVSAKLLDDSCKTMEWVVQDNGPGPTEEIVATMFEPFATTKREGVGLGLAMCRRIAQRHHGDVNWHRENGRTLFTLRIRTDRIVYPITPSGIT
jgi:signal transduction histidine kinase